MFVEGKFSNLIHILFPLNLYILKICWGGKVPKELYTDKNDSLTKNEDFVDTTIKKGGKINLALNCTDNDHLLK